jgi:sortase (surface protein transpeptidase)
VNRFIFFETIKIYSFVVYFVFIIHFVSPSSLILSVDLFKIYKPSEMQRAKEAGYKEKEASLNENNTKCD